MRRRHRHPHRAAGTSRGLNSVIKSVVCRGWENGVEVVGIRKGFEGLTHLDLADPASKARFVIELNRDNTRTIDRHGGTILHSSRVGPTTVRDLRRTSSARAPADARKGGSPTT
jgi:6-phosphofructokinase 1